MHLRFLCLAAFAMLALHLPSAGAAESSATVSAQLPRKQWALLAPSDDPRQGSEGTQTERAYRELKLVAPATPIIVAVIDSGIDDRHPDLKNVLWTNPGEAAGKPGSDDDGNGYIDDLHGWNFLGSADGTREVGSAPLEQARIVGRWKTKAASGALTASQMELYRRAEKRWNDSIEAQLKQLERINEILPELRFAVADLAKLGVTDNTATALSMISATNAARQSLEQLIPQHLGKGGSFAKLVSRYEELGKRLAAATTIPADTDAVVGDDPNNDNQRNYGNPKPMGGAGSAQHGTHVAGIIAAQRANDEGIEGQCAFARIMCIRAVPDGDERDKDVANAIRYAVENGARIINCSFGKEFSPSKAAVDAACRFAESRGVLLVKAAGNEALNLDARQSYPNRIPLDAPAKPFTNWLMVGASTRNRAELAASFSNYGKTQVDLFAPGASILSTVPNNAYESLDGTSMAAPNAAGVAALVLSQYPQLNAVGLRAVLMHTARTYPNLRVPRPGGFGKGRQSVLFSDLSISGGVIDAYAALCYLRDNKGVPPATAAVFAMPGAGSAP